MFRLLVLVLCSLVGVLRAGGATAVGTTTPPFVVIPLEPGNHWQSAADFDAIADAGLPIVFGGDPREPAQVRILESPGARPRVLTLPIASATTTERLSGDGRKLFLNLASGLASVDLVTGESTILAPGVPNHGRWGADHEGRWLAYLSPPNGGSTAAAPQLFLLDSQTAARHQITDAMAPPDEAGCAGRFGVRPLLSADASTLVFVAAGRIRAVDPPLAMTCRVWTYQVASGVYRMVAELPDARVQEPALDALARWYSFTLVRQSPTGATHSDPALLDLRSGALTESLTGDTQYSTFDTIVTGNGQTVVLSSMADLDASVGNPDHNMETFLYDIAERTFTQVTDTSGGIEPGVRGRCPGYSPEVNRTGEVVAFTYGALELAEECVFVRPHRHRSTGLYYRFARTVRRRAGNRPAALSGLPAVATVRPGETLELRATASDPDGDPITFFAQEVESLDVPHGAVIEDHYDGSATLRWRPRLEQAGEYVVRFVAFDEGGGETQQDVHIRVGGSGGGDGCPGDCDGDGEVGIAELVAAVDAALSGDPARCAAADVNADGQVTVDELIAATGAALRGCP